MHGCPICRKRLVRHVTPQGTMHVCGECGGRAVGFAVLRKDAGAEEFTASLMKKARYALKAGPRRCPHCTRGMAAVTVPSAHGYLELDVCNACRLVWFDPSEYAEAAGPRAGRQAGRPAEDAEAAMAEEPESLWRWLPAVLGMPIELRQSVVRQRPWLTWGIAAVTILAFIWLSAKGALHAVIGEWGFLPAGPLRHGGLTLITSFFLHADVVHLLGNMYFLLIFADNVEDRLGRGRLAALLVGAHLVGMIAHASFDPRPGMPCVGASAGISGVIACYAVLFPHARLGLLFWVFFVPLPIRISAVVALVLYVGFQFLLAWAQIGGFSNVSALGHLGGLAVGLLAGGIVRALRAGSEARRMAPASRASHKR